MSDFIRTNKKVTVIGLFGREKGYDSNKAIEIFDYLAVFWHTFLYKLKYAEFKKAISIIEIMAEAVQILGVYKTAKSSKRKKEAIRIEMIWDLNRNLMSIDTDICKRI